MKSAYEFGASLADVMSEKESMVPTNILQTALKNNTGIRGMATRFATRNKPMLDQVANAGRRAAGGISTVARNPMAQGAAAGLAAGGAAGGLMAQRKAANALIPYVAKTVATKAPTALAKVPQAGSGGLMSLLRKFAPHAAGTAAAGGAAYGISRALGKGKAPATAPVTGGPGAAGGSLSGLAGLAGKLQGMSPTARNALLGGGAGALAGGLYGLVNPGRDEDGRPKSRLSAALRNAAMAGGLGAGIGGGAGYAGYGM